MELSDKAKNGFYAIQGCCSHDVCGWRKIEDYPNIINSIKETLLSMIYFCKENNIDFHFWLQHAELQYFMENRDAIK